MLNIFIFIDDTGKIAGENFLPILLINNLPNPEHHELYSGV